MTTITADDIRVLAQSTDVDPVLVMIGDVVRVVPAAEATAGSVVYTKRQLLDELGTDVTDVEAEILAAGLTANL